MRELHKHRPTQRVARAVLLLLAVSLLLAVAVDQLVGDALGLDPASIRDRLDNAGPWAPLLLIGLMALAVVVTPIPSVPLDIAAGLSFGWFWGVVFTMIGAEIGAIIAFLLARTIARRWVRRHISTDTVAAIDAAVERRGFMAITLMRLLPVFNFDWVSYAAGLTRMKLTTFAAATAVGMLIPVMAIVAVGDQLVERPAVGIALFAVLAAMVVVPLIWWSIVPDAQRADAPPTE